MQQNRYWNYLAQTLGQSNYLHLYREKSDDTERYISMFAAISSSASIAAWAVWREWSFIWGIIIAASQLLSAVRSYLPYARRADALREATSGYKRLAMRVESNWFRVAEGILSDEEINELITQFHKEQFEIEDKLFAKITLTERPDLLAIAEQTTADYFTKLYEQ